MHIDVGTIKMMLFTVMSMYAKMSSGKKSPLENILLLTWSKVIPRSLP